MYASITEKSNDTEDPVLLFATLAVAEAKSAPSSGSFAIRSKSVATRCVRTSELEAHHSITFKARCGNCDDDAVFWRIFSCQYASNTREAFLMSLSNGTANVFDTASKDAFEYRPIAKHAISTIALGNGLHASRSVHRIVAYNSLASRRI